MIGTVSRVVQDKMSRSTTLLACFLLYLCSFDISQGVGFLKHPQDITEQEQQNVTFDCFGTGEPTPTVTWFFKGNQLQLPATGSNKYSIAGFGDSNFGALTIFNLVYADHGTYTCMVSNGFRAINDSAILKVQEFPLITAAPANTNTTTGGLVRLVCNATGFPIPDIAWYKNNTPITELNDPRLITSRTENAENLMAVGVLSVQGAVLSHSGVYSCNASNSLKSAKEVSSNTATLSVQYPASITRGLQNITIRNETDSVIFSCTVIGIPHPNIIWARANSSQSPFTSTFLTNSSKTETSTTETLVQHNQIMINTTLEVRNLRKEDDEGYYRCTAINNVQNLIQANHDSTGHLIVQVPPVVTSVSTALYHLRNSTVSIKFARVFPAVQLSNIQWIYTTENGSRFLNTSFPNTRYNFSSDLLTLTITNLQVADDGNYTLVALNEAGISNATYNLTVFVIAKLLMESGISVEHAAGTDFSLTCVADGIPEPKILWKRNEVIIPQNVLSRLSLSSDIRRPAFRRDIVGFKRRQWGVESVLTITSISADLDDAFYGCQANNIDGIAATIQDPPFMLSVSRDNINYCDSSPCHNGGTCEKLKTGFQCACPSTFGGSMCTEEIILPDVPQITLGPSPAFLNLFDPVNFTCTSTGIPTPIIRWFKDGVQLSSGHIVGQNLVFQETKVTDRGFYHCEAENSIGRAESAKVVLNFKNIVQYDAILSIQLSQLSSSNITQAIISTINEFNSHFGARPTSSSAFFFIQIKDLSQIKNTSEHVTMPMILTIVATNEIEEEMQRPLAFDALRQFGFQFINKSSLSLDCCPANITIIKFPNFNESLNLVITWPETFIGVTRRVPCPCEFSLHSTALIAIHSCGGSFLTGAQWENLQDQPCRFSVTARRLCLLATVTDPVLRIEGLDNITQNTGNIGFTETTIATSGADSVLGNAMNDGRVANSYINVVDNLLSVNISALQMSQSTSNSSGRLNAGLNSVVQALNMTNGFSSMDISRQNFFIQLMDINPKQFNASNFNNPNITIPQNLLENAGAAQDGSKLRIAQAIYKNTGLHLGHNIGQRVVSSKVLGFTVFGREIRNLKPSINITLRQEMNNDVNRSLVQAIECAFWNQSDDGGRGNWSTEGCKRINSINISDPVIICQCDHLTSFAVLLDFVPRPVEDVLEQVLQAYSIIGCVVSLVCLIVTVITYIASPKLRQSEATQLLLNLMFGLKGLYVAYIVGFPGNTITDGVCAAVGFFFHFFILVVFFAIGVEAVDLFMKLVIVLGPKIHNFTLKTILVLWITPLFIVLFCFAPSYKNYTQSSHCGPSKEPFYVGVLIPFVAIYLFIFIIFTVIVIKFILKRCKNHCLSEDKTKGQGLNTKQQLRIALTIALLFGFFFEPGWILGLAVNVTQSLPLYIEIPFRIVSTTLVSFHGLFLFIIYVIFSPIARNKWKKWILCNQRKG